MYLSFGLCRRVCLITTAAAFTSTTRSLEHVFYGPTAGWYAVFARYTCCRALRCPPEVVEAALTMGQDQGQEDRQRDQQTV